MNTLSNRPTFCTSEVCELFDIHPNTLKLWVSDGCPIESLGSKGRGKSHRFFLGDVIRWYEKREITRARKLAAK